jgi:hypothetical protein
MQSDKSALDDGPDECLPALFLISCVCFGHCVQTAPYVPCSSDESRHAIGLQPNPKNLNMKVWSRFG